MTVEGGLTISGGVTGYPEGGYLQIGPLLIPALLNSPEMFTVTCQPVPSPGLLQCPTGTQAILFIPPPGNVIGLQIWDPVGSATVMHLSPNLPSIFSLDPTWSTPNIYITATSGSVVIEARFF